MVGGGSIIQAIRGGGSGDVTRTHLLWNLTSRAPSNLSSPLVFGKQLFLVKRGGLASSFDVNTGMSQWETKRIGNLGEYYSSPIAGDGKIYVTGENGFVVVMAPGPEFKVLAKNDVGGTCIATPAIANGRIFVRTREKLFCIEEK
jgi:outer membrane protein assembly factor BamB